MNKMCRNLCMRRKERKMKQNYDLTDIVNVISEKMNNPMVDIVRNGTVGVAGLVNPFFGVAAGIGNDLLSKFNDFKLGCLLNGLASEQNTEKRLNQLYTYVNSTPEKAIIVANLFKQTINAESPKACIIYGMIMANHLDKDTKFTHEELIVCKAIESATDYDLDNFKEIMDNYMKSINGERKIVFPNGFPKTDELISTCDWCVYNRIFISKTLEVESFDDVVLDMGTHYYESPPARVLLDYINDTKRIWYYDDI